MVNLRLQKRLAASIMKCGRRKVWIDPNEMNEIDGSKTRIAVRKLIRDGFIIKKPQKIHSRFHARRRAIEKKKGRHLGHGSRKGTRNARNPVKDLWMKRQRAIRRLLQRYRETGKIDRKMYHRFYVRGKGNAFKNKANLIEHIDTDLTERKRQKALLEEYNARKQEALKRRQEKDAAIAKALSDQTKLADQAQKSVLAQQQRLKKEAEQATKAKHQRQKQPKGQPKAQGKGQSKGQAKGQAKGQPKAQPKAQAKAAAKSQAKPAAAKGGAKAQAAPKGKKQGGAAAPAAPQGGAQSGGKRKRRK